MGNQALTRRSQSQCEPPPLTLAALIDEWLPKLAVNAGAALDEDAQAVYRSIWLEGLADLPLAVVLAAFRKTLKECVYWPVKVADIRKHVTDAEVNATAEAADIAWQNVLETRRLHYNPDIPGPLTRELANLSERVQQAARAAGVFRDFESLEALHTWAKKRFVESFLAWETLEQDQYLLPDGEVRNLLSGLAATKAIPALPPSVEDKP